MKINTDKHSLTIETLSKYLTYDPCTGVFKRIATRKNAGKLKILDCDYVITSMNNRGYLWTKIEEHVYLCHRLAVLIMTGRHPPNEVDHINGNRLDNRWENLRETTAFENSRNQGIRKDCTSGTRGVSYLSSSRHIKRWIARISHMGVRYHLGYYLTKEEAIEARKKAEIDFGYHENHAKRQSWRE